MARLGWTKGDVSRRLKDDPGKLALAARVKQETTLPIRWIAARLQMGSPKSLRPTLHDWIYLNERPAHPGGSKECTVPITSVRTLVWPLIQPIRAS